MHGNLTRRVADEVNNSSYVLPELISRPRFPVTVTRPIGNRHHHQQQQLQQRVEVRQSPNRLHLHSGLFERGVGAMLRWLGATSIYNDILIFPREQNVTSVLPVTEINDNTTMTLRHHNKATTPQ